MDFIRCDENDIPHLVQHIRIWRGKFEADMFDDQTFDFDDYEVERLLGKSFENCDQDKIWSAVEVLAEREYWEKHK